VKYWVLFAMVLFAFCPGAKAQEKIEWQAMRKLTVNAFKGRPRKAAAGQTLSVSLGIEIQLPPARLPSLVMFNNQVTNVFYSDSSWIDWREPSRLRYAIALFDLNEWMARELRKRFQENRELVLAGHHGQIQEKVSQEFQALREAYDNETNYGQHAPGQLSWERRMADALAALADYCKSCR
jgi:hypothetical protein